MVLVTKNSLISTKQEMLIKIRQGNNKCQFNIQWVRSSSRHKHIGPSVMRIMYVFIPPPNIIVRDPYTMLVVIFLWIVISVSPIEIKAEKALKWTNSAIRVWVKLNKEKGEQQLRNFIVNFIF